jgi:hypothetical protein
VICVAEKECVSKEVRTEVIQNHEIENVRYIGQGEARQKI